jgi:uncharacterized protein
LKHKPGKKIKVNRIPERGFYDSETINKIIDGALYCHISFIQDGHPFIIPTIHARMNDHLVFHGAKASRLLKQISGGEEIAVSVTILDGLVLARSVFHHSMNYRSVVIFGKGKLIEDENEKLNALEAITNHILPGRWDDARKPSEKELNATSVVSLKIDEASAKIRSGPPKDEEEDYDLPVWAGVIPLSKKFGQLEEDPKLKPGILLPDYIDKFIKSKL